VQVAQNLLVRPHQEDAQVVLVVVGRVQLQHVLHFRLSMKCSIFPSESQVMSASTARRVGLLVQPVDGHDREELVDGPRVRQRLEDGEVAEVRVRQLLLQRLQLLGISPDSRAIRMIFWQMRPEDVLRLARAGPATGAQGEEGEALLLVVLGVVVGSSRFLFVTSLKVAMRLRTTEWDLSPACRGCGPGRTRSCQHVHHQHGVVGHHGAARLGHQRGVRHPALSHASITPNTTSLAYSEVV
jgi:hypothetical protein